MTSGEGVQMRELLEENLRKVLSYLASETMKARKNGKIGRAERLSVAFKILSEEYDDIKHHKEAEN
jgi:SHS2 domain-containing protein